MHGWGGNKDSLAALALPFSREYRVTQVDLYGFGDTPHPDKALILDDFAEAVVALIRFYKMTSVVLVGHSFGGKVALWTARKYGMLIDRIVLIDASGMRPRRGLRYCYKVLLYKFRKNVGLSTRLSGSADYREAKGYQKQTFVNIVNTHLDKELSYITLPALLLWGANDADTPLYMGRKMARRLVRGRLIVLKGAGHFSYLDQYAECLAHIKAFIGGANG
ncbi:MAG: alpha/beta hydrolase [Clostridia bacterium]|nr:alpha/beta hydrolase [Clostridia bacterium]